MSQAFLSKGVDNLSPLPWIPRVAVDLPTSFRYVTICTLDSLSDTIPASSLTEDPMNCIVYARVSTDKQAEKELSIPAQLQAMREYARQHDWKIVQEFLEPGVSAKTVDRPALQRLLSYVRDSEIRIEVVLVAKIDRLA